MLNREIYRLDPSKQKLVNEGVANVNDDTSKISQDVLRYELETFVCDGQYEKGMRDILDTYLKNIYSSQQPGVWVSGFYGSGKSHLVKMIRALWVNSKFEDSSTAREIAKLPDNIKDFLKELDTQGKRHGGLHAASGTLGSSANGSVRLAILNIIFKSAGLPGNYPVAKFIMWLKKEKIYDELKNKVEAMGAEWEEELDNFHVAEDLHMALTQIKSDTFSNQAICAQILSNQYPIVHDISNDEMIKAIENSISVDGKFPLTLIVFDEVQQYIGEDSQRSIDVQEAVEACCKSRNGGKLMFVGTGQTAVTGTPNLKRLEGRFTVRIELSDTDVERVIRKVILDKKPIAIKDIKETLEKNMGEISRHLSDTSIAHQRNDIDSLDLDYPILPVRRRFWEKTLKVLDQTGTDSQLRNQLSMIHKAIQSNLDKPLGNVVSGDFLYFESADKLLQSRILPRKVHEKTMSWIYANEEEKLMARACGLIFLITKLSSINNEIGIKSNIDTIADLMVEDISVGSSSLRKNLPQLLDKCELLIKVGDEYRIQTEESTAWNDEFLSNKSQLSNQLSRIDNERNERIKAIFAEKVKNKNFTQGKSKVPREISITFDNQLPNDKNNKVYVWIRDGWSTEENSVKVDARQEGNESPTIFVFIPKLSGDGLRQHIIEFKASLATLERKGIPNTPEGKEARSAMETTKLNSESKIRELLNECLASTKVFQGGGNEIFGENLQQAISEAADKSFFRLYSQFSIADHEGWEKVYSQAKKGPDSLKAVGFEDEAPKNPVCKLLLSYIAGIKNGSEIKTNFSNAPYGWSGDAIDGAIQALLVSNSLIALNDRNLPINPTDLERKLIGKSKFKVESTTVTTGQKIKIRQLFQKLNCPFENGDEHRTVNDFLSRMQELSGKSGGEEPKPELPDTSLITEISRTSGNEQLITIFNNFEKISQQIDSWKDLSEKVEKMWPLWTKLQELLQYDGKIADTDDIRKQAEAIKKERYLIYQSDLISPLLKSAEDILRKELNSKLGIYKADLKKHFEQIESDELWKNLTKDEQLNLLNKYGIKDIFEIKVGTYENLISGLKEYPLNSWNDRTSALPDKFAKLRAQLIKEQEPETQTVNVPRRTLRNESEIRDWVNEVEVSLKEALSKGPVLIN